MLGRSDNGEKVDLLQLSSDWRHKLSGLLDVSDAEASDGELVALVSFAIAFPESFTALVDTYDVKRYSWASLPCMRFTGTAFVLIFIQS